MEKIIAAVGCGYWGKNLVRNFAEIGALRYVCDPVSEVAETLAKQHDAEVATFEEIIFDSDIEAVVLAVPAPLHASMAIKAMTRGKHVYVEKPLAMNQTEAESMIKASVKNQVHLMVGHLLQYHPVFVKLKKVVNEGTLGNLNYLYSNRLSLGKVRSEEDVIWSFAPHDLSMILSLVGEQPKTVRTEHASILQHGIADSAMIHMEFSANLRAHVNVSWFHPYKEQKLVVIGDAGMAVFDDTQSWERKLSIFRHQIEYLDNVPTLNKADAEYLDVPQAEPLKQECKFFINLIKGYETPLTDGQEGLRVLEVLTAASLSLAENRPVGVYDYA